MTQPFLLPWVRVLLLIRSITTTTWGHEAWPEVKPVLRRALEMRRQMRARAGAAGSVLNRDGIAGYEAPYWPRPDRRR
jgi:hypothetical protein